MLFSVPSKTFLLGEYVALTGGPAIILTTEYRFNLIAKLQKATSLSTESIDQDSPAGKLIQSDTDFYKHYTLRFIDPYKGLGGFGASSAQFILSYALRSHECSQKIEYEALLNDYNQFSWDGKGIPPSGADVIAQLYGGVCYFYKREKKIKIFSWPFSTLNYGLIHTGNKLATHVHLSSLNTFDTVSLTRIIELGLKSIEEKNGDQFAESIQQYAHALAKQNLTKKETSTILKRLLRNPKILAAKGCGALGADVVLILYQKDDQQPVLDYIQSLTLNIIFYGDQASSGLKLGDNL